jgi:hypothetical protein
VEGHIDPLGERLDFELIDSRHRHADRASSTVYGANCEGGMSGGYGPFSAPGASLRWVGRRAARMPSAWATRAQGTPLRGTTMKGSTTGKTAGTVAGCPANVPWRSCPLRPLQGLMPKVPTYVVFEWWALVDSNH